jgi:NAD(P)-dependent dehydrogenase (short-subunit alcohol dehydrogenase family)
MKIFRGRTAVLTGAASGFGLALSRLLADEGMHIVMVDVQQDALDAAGAEVAALAKVQGARVLTQRMDVAKADAMDALGQTVHAAFGAPSFVFNNAGVGSGGLIWENTAADWEWVMGVNVFGVAHGLRVFTPMMLKATQSDPSFQGHIVNTASMAGLLSPPTMGVYNASKHAVVSMTETLHHDLALVTDRIHCSVLCPYFVPTGIHESHRNRTNAMAKPTLSQRVAQAQSEKAVTSGKVSATDVARLVVQAARDRRFYVYSHPQAIKGVQTRLEDIMLQRNPTDPFAERPDIGQALRDKLSAKPT